MKRSKQEKERQIDRQRMKTRMKMRMKVRMRMIVEEKSHGGIPSHKMPLCRL
jgi:hypothetical protein